VPAELFKKFKKQISF